MKKKFTYDHDVNFALCEISHNNLSIIGTASCCPEDEDMASEKTGLFIAECRANIRYLRYLRDIELKNQLKSLQQVQSCMESSKKYNPKSYEAKMLLSQIRTIKNQLTVVELELLNEKRTLREFIENKELFYQKIRKGRNN